MSQDRQHCYHCDLPIPNGTELTTEIFGEPRKMCCPGCQAVSQAIVDNQLDDYYRFRTEPAVKADEQHGDILSQLTLFDDPSVQEEFVSDLNDEKIVQLSIDGISCSACGWLIEKKLSQVPGLKRVAVNVSAQRATLTWDDTLVTLSQLLTVIDSIGYHARPFQPDKQEANYSATNKAYLKRLGLSGLMTMQVMMLAIGLYFSLFGYIDPDTRRFFHYISLLLSIPVVTYSAVPFYQGAFRAIKNGTVNMDVPIVIATIGGFIASCYTTITDHGTVYFESICMFIFLLLVSRYVEHKSRARATELSSNSMKHVPITATRVAHDGSYTPCPAKQLNIGDIILVKPGDTIPADAVVTSGNSEVDESMLTGEFSPVIKEKGSPVYGGTINHAGSIECRVETPLKDALVNQIMRLQELALANKPAISQFADNFSRYFVVAVLIIAACSTLYWYLTEPTLALPVAIAVLVATCPCALGLATPVALTCGMARLSSHGILVKNADTLETINQVKHVVFDKTGTLTNGDFNLIDWRNHSTLRDEQVLSIVASIESVSEHPIAKALSSLSESKTKPLEPEVTVGQGISGRVDDIKYYVGSRKFIAKHHDLSQSSIPSTHQVILASAREILGSFELKDKIKPGSTELVKQLSPRECSILSGDTRENVEDIASQLGIHEYKAHASPEDKLNTIQAMQHNNSTVMMVGDGINDAPTLSAANVSVAIGGSTDLARSAADIICLDNRLNALPTLFESSLKVSKTIKQNIGWAIGYNLCVLPLAVSGILSPWVAVIGMSLSSIIVVSNSVRLLR